MDRGAWWTTVHGVAKSERQLKQLGHKHARLRTDHPGFIFSLSEPFLCIQLFLSFWKFFFSLFLIGSLFFFNRKSFLNDWRRKWQSTPALLPGNPMDRRA